MQVYIGSGTAGGGTSLGRDLNEDAAFIQLSDGGHFENLGLYELFRRRAEVIVVSDAGADVRFGFADLANALERCRVDFGTNVRFRDGRDLLGLIADEEISGLDYKVSDRGCAIADIWYSTDEDTSGDSDVRPPDGVLYYIKSTMIEGLTADLVGYKKANEDFPDQSTADQWFSEPQFEAYRELGYQLTRRMLDDEDLRGAADQRGSQRPGGPAFDHVGRLPAVPPIET